LTSPPEKPLHIAQRDWDDAYLSELTDADFARMVPFKDAHPEAYAARELTRGETSKKLISFRLDSVVIDCIRATGEGYDARVERVLREALAAGKLDAPSNP
jgi:uncharacterized protein (DUF4415 family)